MPTQLRGPLKHFATAGLPTPLASPSVVGTPQPFLSGAPLEAVDTLPVLSYASTGDDTPRCFGYAWNGTTYPGPYTEAAGSVENLSVTSPTGTAASISDQAALGGKQRLTPQATTDNANGYLGSSAGTYIVVAGKRIWFEVRLANPIATQTQGEIFAGLSATTFAADLATPPTDGIFFLKADAANTFTFHVRASAASTTITDVFGKAGVTAPVQNGAFNLGFLVDASNNPNTSGLGPVSCYVNGRLAGAIASTDANLAALVAGLTSLSLCIGRQNSGANTDTLDIFQCLCIEEL